MKPLTFKQDGEQKEFQQLPAGNHAAYCTRIIDIGHQEVKKFPPEPGTEIIPQMILCFETPNELMEDGQPFIIYGFPMKVSTHEKSNMYATLNALNGEPVKQEFWGKFIMAQTDLKEFVGKQCQIEVIERFGKEFKGDDGMMKRKTYSNIKGVHPLPKGMTMPKMHNEPLYFDLEKFSQSTKDMLPGWIQAKIDAARDRDRPEPDKAPAPAEGSYGAKDQDIPF